MGFAEGDAAEGADWCNRRGRAADDGDSFSRFIECASERVQEGLAMLLVVLERLPVFVFGMLCG